MLGYSNHLDALGDSEADVREDALRRALADCAEALPEASRRALELRYRDALDFTAIAEAVGRTVAGARQLLQRARNDLRHCIQEKLT